MSIHQNNHGEKVKMEVSKLNFIQNGAIRLPPGFRFQPSDHEIVFQYLIRKVFACPLPASIVPEIANVCKFNPWELPGNCEQDRYFFSKNNEAKYGHGSTRSSSDGYWKENGIGKKITRCCNINLITRKQEMIMGMKNTFVFYKRKPMCPGFTTRTRWVMHEYRLVHPTYSPKTNSNDNITGLLQQRSCIQMGDWVLCHIFLNKRGRKAIIRDEKLVSSGLTPQAELVHHGFMTRNDEQMNVQHEQPLSASSSSSSCGSNVVTQEVSSSRKLLHQKLK